MQLVSQFTAFSLLALLANLKVFITGKLKLSKIKSVLVFNGIVFGIIALIFSGCLFSGTVVSKFTVITAFLYAGCTVAYQILYVLALEKGPISLLILINNFYVVPCAVAGAIFFNEDFSFFQIIGLITTLISVFLIVGNKKGDKKGNTGFILMTVAMIASALAMLIQRYHQKTEFAYERNGFLFFSYLFSAIAVFIIYLFLKNKSISERNGKKIIISGIQVGFILAAYQILLITLSGKVNSMVMYPLNSGLTLIVNFIMCAIFFKEKMLLRQKIGAIIGVIAVIITVI